MLPSPRPRGAAMSVHIDINCDMGESYGRWTLGADEEIMPNITSANIACGFHGGDPHIMRKTVELAVQHGVAAGAPPRRPGLIGCGGAAGGCAPRASGAGAQLAPRSPGRAARAPAPAKAAEQAVRMVREGKARTIPGRVIDAKTDPISTHGDSPGAEKIVPAVRDA